MSLVVYADGGCSPNPGPGGWGVVMQGPGGRYEMRGGEPGTTNNRMELTAAIRALEALPPGTRVEMRLDSQYVVKAMTEWLRGWKAKGWRTTTGEVKNVDLIRRLDTLAAARAVRWTWVRGHNGDPGNERADALVDLGRREAAKGIPETREGTPPGPVPEPVPREAGISGPGEAAARAASVPIDLALGLELSRAAKRGGTTPQALVERAVRLALVLGPTEVERLLRETGKAA